MRGAAGALIALAACTAPAPAPPGSARFAVATHDVLVLAVGDEAHHDALWFDRAGVPLTAPRPTWRSSNSEIVRVDDRGRIAALAPGEARVEAIHDEALATTFVRVVRQADTGAVVDVAPTVRHQVINGWEAVAGIGEADCHPDAVARYRDDVLHRAVDELGITRLRIALRSGTETRHDHWPDFRAGRLRYAQWRATWMVATNDNADPFVADPDGFQWGWFDSQVETIVLPMRDRLARRGERLFVNLNYVDFFLTQGVKPFAQMREAEEYAELVLVTFQHMQQRFGFVPDAVELNLEPENTTYTGADMGRALVATQRRLAAAGFHPEFIGPSTTRAANAIPWHDAMLAIPGAGGLLREFSYHTYTGVSTPTRQAIRIRALRDSMRVSMLEHIGSGFDGLYEDLTVAHASAWEQFTLAYCGMRSQPGNGGVYYQVDQSNPEAPRVNITYEARLLRQVFAWVRPGAVRIGAASQDTAVRVLAFIDQAGRETVVLRTRQAREVRVRGLSPGRYMVNYSERTGRVAVDADPMVVGADGEGRVRLPGDVALTLQRREVAP